MDAEFRSHLENAATGGAPNIEPPPVTPPSPEAFRAAPPHATVRPQLGALADLPGTWFGRGFSFVALPVFKGAPPAPGSVPDFRLMMNATNEIITFTLTGAPIPDRGLVEPDISYVGLHYFQQVVDAQTNAGLHLETGMWLNLPPKNAVPQVTRLSSIPHGDSLLAEGTSFFVQGGPRIQPANTLPFRLDPTTGAPTRQFPLGYTDIYMNSAPPGNIPKAATLDPNVVLTEAIRGQTIVRTAMLFVNATPVGGINGTPIAPPSKPNTVGGILNIPFVKANADANSLSAIFWIETVKDAKTGDEFLQLQYTQTTILEFGGIKWPHVTVGTLIQQ